MSTSASALLSTTSLKNWDVSQFYTLPKKGCTQSRIINVISKSTNKKVKIDTSFLFSYGPDSFRGSDSYTLDLQFPTEEQHKTPETQLLLEKLRAHEDSVVANAIANPKTFFGHENLTETVIKSRFVSALKTSGTKYPTNAPKIKPQFGYKSDFSDLQIYNVHGTLLYGNNGTVCVNDTNPLTLIPKNCMVKAVLEIKHIYVMEKSWGITWKVVQAVVKSIDSETGEDKIEVEEFEHNDVT